MRSNSYEKSVSTGVPASKGAQYSRKLEDAGIRWHKLDGCGPRPSYSSLFQGIPTYSNLFPAKKYSGDEIKPEGCQGDKTGTCTTRPGLCARMCIAMQLRAGTCTSVHIRSHKKFP